MPTTIEKNARIDAKLVSEFSGIESPRVLLEEIFSRFGQRAAIGTSGQLTGCVLIDLASKAGHPFRVFVVDTLRLHRETYRLWSELEDHYGISLERFQPNPRKLDLMVRQHGEFLFFDGKAKQEYCCQVRKSEPNEMALETLDVWVTGLRKDQSRHRLNTPKVEILQKYGHPILKVCPLVDWDEEKVRRYIAENKVPYNPLFDPQPDGSRYPSLGCIICTTPVLPHESSRDGRWRWFNVLEQGDKKECGIHFNI